MSQENVEVVKRSIAALNDRDIDRYLAYCTPDLEIHTPFGSLEGVFGGAARIRRYWANIADSVPDFRLTVERLESIGADRVLAFSDATAAWRAMAIASVYDLAAGKIRRIRIFVDRQEALEAVGLRE